ncbi:MAG: nitronate monooxygenase [Bacteroidetes bacterium]|nr:nitronate monooxygenase [Bacteroidota bacterium]
MENKVSSLLGIQYPIIQGGMIWCSGWRLASAVSNEGGLGLIGSGSMYPEVLREHIKKCKQATHKPFGVNIPLLYPNIEEHIKIIIEEGVKIVVTSAGNPKTWTSHLKQHGIKVIHAVSNIKFALKCQEAGVDAVIAEGFEAGGHNGREETTTLVLIPAVKKVLQIPLIAAGGIGSGQAIAAAFCLGADAVQIGSLFAATEESSAHLNFKKAIVQAQEGDTQLTLKQLTPVRLIKNKFFQEVYAAEKRGAGIEELQQLLGRARAKKGMFEGDLEEGELEIGQVSGSINEIKTVAQVMKQLVEEFTQTQEHFKKISVHSLS